MVRGNKDGSDRRRRRGRRGRRRIVEGFIV
jgi:hypothetical protein